MKHKITLGFLPLLVVTSLYANECMRVFPDVFSSETVITFESRLNVDSKSDLLQTLSIEQSHPYSKCADKECKATQTKPSILKPFEFKSSTIDDTIEINSDTILGDENLANIIVTEDDVTLTFKAPSPTKGFTPIQKIGSLKIEGKNVTLVFEGGDYYIKSFEAKSSISKDFRGMIKNDKLTITPKANIRLFIDEDFYISKTTPNPIDKTLLINDDAKAKKLMLYVKGDIEIDATYNINAIIYGYKNIKLNSNPQTKFSGAIHAKDELTLSDRKSFKNGEFTYDEESIKELWKLSTCRALPDEPDEQLNNSTLLGIDTNRNGVRDDVERWIIDKYKDKHPIHIDIAMQAANAYKKVLETPEEAVEIRDEVNGALFCAWYYENDAEEFGDPILVHGRIDVVVKGKYFNTSIRKDIYKQYDIMLSGGSYDNPWAKERKKMCNFDTKKYEEK